MNTLIVTLSCFAGFGTQSPRSKGFSQPDAEALITLSTLLLECCSATVGPTQWAPQGIALRSTCSTWSTWSAGVHSGDILNPADIHTIPNCSTVA